MRWVEKRKNVIAAGKYEIAHMGVELFRLNGVGSTYLWFPTANSAKAAAQRDSESAIVEDINAAASIDDIKALLLRLLPTA